MLFQPYIVIYQNVQGHSAVAWPPLCTKSKCFISSQNFFTLWPGKLHMISDRDIYKLQPMSADSRTKSLEYTFCNFVLWAAEFTVTEVPVGQLYSGGGSVYNEGRHNCTGGGTDQFLQLVVS